MDKIYEAVSLVTDYDWRTVWWWGTMLQKSMLHKIEEQLSTSSEPEEGHRLCAAFYIRYNPKASWQHLCRILYQNEQEDALEIVKGLLPPKGIFFHYIMLMQYSLIIYYIMHVFS